MAGTFISFTLSYPNILYPLLVLLAAVISDTRATSLQKYFLNDILAVYGENGSLDLNGIHSLLETVVHEKPEDLNIPVHAQVIALQSLHCFTTYA